MDRTALPNYREFDGTHLYEIQDIWVNLNRDLTITIETLLEQFRDLHSQLLLALEEPLNDFKDEVNSICEHLSEVIKQYETYLRVRQQEVPVLSFSNPNIVIPRAIGQVEPELALQMCRVIFNETKIPMYAISDDDLELFIKLVLKFIGHNTPSHLAKQKVNEIRITTGLSPTHYLLNIEDQASDLELLYSLRKVAAAKMDSDIVIIREEGFDGAILSQLIQKYKLQLLCVAQREAGHKITVAVRRDDVR